MKQPLTRWHLAVSEANIGRATNKHLVVLLKENMMDIEWLLSKEYTDVLYYKADGIAKIVINRPDLRNAFRPQQVKELHDDSANAQRHWAARRF